MAIEQSTDLDTGYTANYWKISDVRFIKPRAGGGFSARVEYHLYADAASYAAGRTHVGGQPDIRVEVTSVNPRLSDWEAAADAELLRKSVIAEPAIQQVKADRAKGIKGVKAKSRVRGVKGGRLEGGKIVP